MRMIRTARVLSAVLVGGLWAVSAAVAHPGHGADVGVAHEMYHVAQAVLVIGVVLGVSALPGYLSARRR